MTTVAPNTVTALPPQAPTAGELDAWNTRRSAARQQYAAQVAGSSLNRNQADVQRQFGLNQWNLDTNQQRAQLPTSFLSRGIYNSGIFQKNLRDFYSQRLQAQQQIQNQYTTDVTGANIGELQAAGGLASTLAQIQGEEQARRADLASQIRGVL